MYIEKHQNAAGCKITVTNTASNIFSLINTAAGTSLNNAGFSGDVNGINIVPEDGDVRALFDGNTPTATNGMLLSSGAIYNFRNVPLDKLTLIRAGGSDVACYVQPGRCNAGETDNVAAYAVTLEASSVTIGDVTADITEIAGTATNVNGGNRDAGTQTVTLADDDPAVSSLSTLAAVPSKAHTTAYAASLVIKSAPGTLKEIRGYNSGAAQFIQVHDASSLPADTAIPEEVIYVPAAQNFAITPKEGSPFGTGIVVCNSSTGPTKTIGAADCWFSAEYV